jgi:1-acyl-sn-glycerol-3-phosphate acyltransferase
VKPSFAKRALRRVFNLVLRVFFRRIEVTGEDGVPREGPILFALNHPNALIDPLLLFCHAPRPVSFLAKEPLFRTPVLGRLVKALDSLPVYRHRDEGADPRKNQETFARARDVLTRGAIAIFPEGTSHSDSKLRRLKTGAARIALGAAAGRAPGDGPLSVVPCGLHYTQKTTFRSDALVVFGEAIPVEPVALAENGDPPREAVDALTARLATALDVVTVQAERPEELLLYADVVTVLDAEDEAAHETDVARRFELSRRVARGYTTLRAARPDEVRPVEERLVSLRTELATHGLRLPDLPTRTYSVGLIAAYLARVFLLPLVLLPIAVAGAAAHYPAYRSIGTLARRFAKGEDDVLATIKVLAALLFFPLTWALAATAAGVAAGPWAALSVALGLPVSGWAAVVFFDGVARLGGRTRAFLYYIFRRAELERVLAERRALRDAIVELGGLGAEVEVAPTPNASRTSAIDRSE